MMKSCEQIQLQLTEYADGTLGRTETRAVRSHLVSCAECRAEMQRELRLRHLLGSLPLCECPDANGRIVHPAARAGFPGRLLVGAGLAAVLLVAVLGWPHVRSSEQPVDGRPVDIAATSGVTTDFTADELAAAQDQLHYSLSLTARIIQRGQRETVQDVFGERLPRVISDSLRKTIHTNQGDQG